MRRWTGPVAIAVVGVLSAGLYDHLVVVVVVLVLTAGLAWYLSPLRRRPHVDHHDAQAQAGADDMLVYWKPGCSVCIALMWRLRRVRSRITWVNIWADDDAAAFVADLNGGDELTPTVVTGGGQRLDPSSEALLGRVGEDRGADGAARAGASGRVTRCPGGRRVRDHQ